jgi:hypothetical protein
MVWIVGAICMILLGAGGVAIGLLLPMLSYAIMGGILVLAGIFWLVSMRRGGGPLFRGLWG